MSKNRGVELHETLNHFSRETRDSQSSSLRNKDLFNEF
jgi:hypothetical protein